MRGAAAARTPAAVGARSAWQCKIGYTIDVLDVKRQLDVFNSQKQVRKTVAQRYPEELRDSFNRFFAELSTYGTHINPKTVGLRLSTPRPNAGNLGFVSEGYTEAPALCAGYVLHTVAYALSEFRDGSRVELAASGPLETRLTAFEASVQTYRVAPHPTDLSLLR